MGAPQRSPVFAASARDGEGVGELFQAVIDCFARAERDGSLEQRRREQRIEWFDAALVHALRERFDSSPNGALRQQLADSVARGEVFPTLAARSLLGPNE